MEMEHANVNWKWDFLSLGIDQRKSETGSGADACGVLGVLTLP